MGRSSMRGSRRASAAGPTSAALGADGDAARRGSTTARCCISRMATRRSSRRARPTSWRRSISQHPDAVLVAGATDVGLWVTKQHRHLKTLIDVTRVKDLAVVEEAEDGLTIGATVSHRDATAALARLHPDLGELMRRFASIQIRNAGTVGGNIANGSPIGDLPPALIALDARLTLRRGVERREIPLEDFFIAYGKQDRAPGEFVESVFVPALSRRTCASPATSSRSASTRTFPP